MRRKKSSEIEEEEKEVFGDFVWNCLLGVDEGLGLFPSENVSTEVTVGAGLLENGSLQLEVLDNAAGTQVEVELDNLEKFLGGLDSSAVVEDCDTEGLSHSDGVGHLDQASLAQISLHQGLGHPAGSVCSASIHLCVILS